MAIHGRTRLHGPDGSLRRLRAIRGLPACVPAVALWLIIAAAPVLADGGPHVASINNASAGLTADGCAGCHRAHTAQAGYLLVEDESTICLTCHGASGTGATTDVASGVQYRLADPETGVVRGEAILGALRNGGFEAARIDTTAVYRTVTVGGTIRTKIPARTSGQAVTSSHLPMLSGLAGANRVWGNGPLESGAGVSIARGLECTSCHNPHGNGSYRILVPIPTLADRTSGGFFTPAATAASVTDAPLPPVGDTRNYTIVQLTGTSSLLASQVAAGSYPVTAGDYFHRRVPWNTSGQTDGPNGQAATFNGQITAWCTACHTRYYDPIGFVDTGDAIYRFRHETASNRACTTCHVAHGSNARMGGVYSASAPDPGGLAARVGDSRLLKFDDRGTCQACHDPTGGSADGTTTGPTPNPITP